MPRARAPLPGTCSQSVPTGISSVMPTRTCTLHLLSSAHSIWSLGLQWMLTKVSPAGWKWGEKEGWARDFGQSKVKSCGELRSVVWAGRFQKISAIAAC